MTQKRWILLAEAGPAAADETLRALAHGFAPPAVVVARDGGEVMDCLHRCNGFQNRPEGDPSVVLLALKLPNVDGWEILRRIRSDARLKSIPVVIFTSSRDTGNLIRSYELGANAYVVKPPVVRQLAAVLEAIRAFWVVINEPPQAALDEGDSDMPQFIAAA